MNEATISGKKSPITAPSIEPTSFLDFLDSFLYAHLAIKKANTIPISKGIRVSMHSSFINYQS